MFMLMNLNTWTDLNAISLHSIAAKKRDFCFVFVEDAFALHLFSCLSLIKVQYFNKNNKNSQYCVLKSWMTFLYC